MSDYDLLPEVDLRPDVEPGTASKTKAGRITAQKIAESNLRRPKWKRQLNNYKANQARHARIQREGGK